MLQETLQVYKGNTFRIRWQLKRDDTWTLQGKTVKMSFRFNDDDIVHTFTGVVHNESLKIVDFTPTAESVATVRKGEFDIVVTDGVNPLTHKKGIIDVINTVTP